MPTIHSTIADDLTAAAKAAGFRIIDQVEDGQGLLLSMVASKFHPEYAEYSDYGVTTCRIGLDGTMTVHEERFLEQPPEVFLDVEEAVMGLVKRERQAIASATIQEFSAAFAAAGVPPAKVETIAGGGVARIWARAGRRVAEVGVGFDMATGLLTVWAFWNRRQENPATVRTLDDMQAISDRLGAEVGNYLDERKAA